MKGKKVKYQFAGKIYEGVIREDATAMPGFFMVFRKGHGAPTTNLIRESDILEYSDSVPED